MHDLLYNSIDNKAQKYGDLPLPFVIGVWGLSFPFETEEKRALYGTQSLVWNRDLDGHAIRGSERPLTLPDGVFTLIQDDHPRNQKVSAVVFYQHRLGDRDHQHLLRVYHSPFTRFPLPPEVFHDSPQFVAKEANDHLEMQWIGEPAPTNAN